MSLRTEETRNDNQRPNLDREPLEADGSSEVVTAPDLDPFEPGDPMEDQATILMARLGWPEPPLSLKDRAEATKRPPGPLSRSVAKFSRSVGGLSKSVAGLPAVARERGIFWPTMTTMVLVAVAASLVLAHRRADQRSGDLTSASALPTVVLSTPARPAARPTLVITVGTPPPPPTPSASEALAPIPARKAGIDVLKLPVAPRHVAAPVARPRRAVPNARPKAAASTPQPEAPAVDDGF